MSQGQAPLGKQFKDAIHDFIDLSGTCVSIIDTPQFHRLKYLKQLGVTYFVYPDAEHSRFQHSLGVAWLAQRYCRKLQQKHRATLLITERDIEKVTIAGLCHDLGHGAFSHVCEHEVADQLLGKTWHHEDMSCRLFDDIVADNDLDLEPSEVQDIKSMIRGQVPPNQDKKFLWRIVANEPTGIDVDKFDYLVRDAFFCGVKVACDTERLMLRSQVDMDSMDIVYQWTEKENVQELFWARRKMHKNVYQHRVAKAIELMIADVLLAAAPILELRDMLLDTREFIKLDDSMIREVYRMKPARVASEHREALQQAQDILGRLYSRNLYGYCGEVDVEVPKAQDAGDRGKPPPLKLPTPEELAQRVHALSAGTVTVQSGDIAVRELKIDSKPEHASLENVKFVGGNKYEDDDMKKYMENPRAAWRPDRGIRAFYKGIRNSQTENYIHQALCQWVRAQDGKTMWMRSVTPMKRRRSNSTHEEDRPPPPAFPGL